MTLSKALLYSITVVHDARSPIIHRLETYYVYVFVILVWIDLIPF